MQNRMEMALAVDVKTDVAADAKTDAAADAEFPAAAAAAETAIRGLAVPERPIPAAAAEHRQRTGNAGHTVRDTATAGTGGTGRAGMMLSGAGMAEGSTCERRKLLRKRQRRLQLEFAAGKLLNGNRDRSSGRSLFPG